MPLKEIALEATQDTLSSTAQLAAGPAMSLYAICIQHMKRPRTQGASAAIRRASTRQWVLKPQDLAVALKLVTLNGAQVSYAALAQQMKLSQFEVHAAVQRLMAARLVVDRDGIIRPNLDNLRPFVLGGAPHAYPPVRGEATIGLPTAHGAAPLNKKIRSAPESIPVWPHPQGTVNGQSLLPLYEKLPLAAMEDPEFHELLALFDALRSGQAREREMARTLLEERLK